MLNIDINQINPYIVNTVIAIVASFVITFLFHIVAKIILKRKRIVNKMNKTKFSKFTIFFILGGIYSLSSLLFFYNNSFNLTINLFNTFALSYFYHYYFYIGTCTTNIVINSLFLVRVQKSLLLFNNNYYIILNYVVIFLSLLLLVIIKFIKWRNNIIFMFINFIVLAVSITVTFPLLFLEIFGINDFIKFTFCFNFVLYLLVSYLIYGCCHLITKFNNDQKLEEIKYKNHFIKSEYSNLALNKFIKDNNVNQALVMKFFIFGLNNILSQYGNSYFKKTNEKIYKNIVEEFKQENVLFYLIDDNSYYAFINISNIDKINLNKIIKDNDVSKRTEGDLLSGIELKFKNIIRKCNEQDIYCSLTSICSLYGITSNNLDYIHNSIEAIKINNWPFMNSIYYESLKYKNNFNLLENKNTILSELNLFSPNDIFINFSIKESKDKNFYAIKAYSLIPYYTNKYDIWTVSNNLMIQSALICHTSAKAIIEFCNQDLNKSINNYLLIDYHQYLLEQESFDPISLINNIDFYGLNVNQFYLNIYFYHDVITDTFINNVKKLMKLNVAIKLDNISKKMENKYKLRLKEH